VYYICRKEQLPLLEMSAARDRKEVAAMFLKVGHKVLEGSVKIELRLFVPRVLDPIRFLPESVATEDQ
jgi:hypothetical protein